MEYRYLGNTGLKTSVVSLGSYLTFGHSVEEKEAINLMGDAFEAGINLFDNAEVYALGRSEQIMGSALRSLNWSRDSYIIMTKLFWGGEKPSQMGLHRKHIVDACNSSLRRLGVDYIDILLCHRPDINTPILETVRAMHNLVSQGKILYWGTSEWSETQILEAFLIAQKHDLTPPSLEQFKYSMLERNKAEKELLPLFKKYKLGATTTMPLVGGLLTGKYQSIIPENSRFSWLKDADKDLVAAKYADFNDKLRLLAYIARQSDITLAQLALGWCLTNKNISSVISGVTNQNQLKENLATLKHLHVFTEDFKAKINSIIANAPSIENRDYLNYASVVERV